MKKAERKGIDQETSEVNSLTKMIQYQEKAIVSKSLIDRKSGTVTLFAFDKGQGLSEHTAPYDALVQIVDGEAEVTLSGKSHHLKTGEIIVMPAREPHALKALARFKMLLTMLKT